MRSRWGATLSCRTPPQWSLPLRRAATPGFAFVRSVSMCHVHLHYDAVSTFLQASKICASSPVLRSVIHIRSVFIHRFSTEFPTRSVRDYTVSLYWYYVFLFAYFLTSLRIPRLGFWLLHRP